MSGIQLKGPSSPEGPSLQADLQTIKDLERAINRDEERKELRERVEAAGLAGHYHWPG